ncbi:hypothetical protein Lfu02_73590 [Longispora fulva]|uniref:Peptidase C39-like domain-containing protein n=1 Tax=Longispora fulva TaxID=619741 RepID=A0A8J7GD65_9ACTN|nr:hypothetical protein [Longispora fulva]MBG6134272.1 hypothetical protein [Longispora fulva]GIG62987.1 hypothetical protein Lfu02_73590 [Longispora fulva]
MYKRILAITAAAAVAGLMASGPASAAGPTALGDRALAQAKASADRPGTDGYEAHKVVTAPDAVSPEKQAWMNSHIHASTIGGPGYHLLTESQQRQWYNNYCGPASLVETLAEHGIYKDQGWAAGVLHTGAPGGSGTNGGEMGPALNAYSGGFKYDEVQVSSPYSNYVASYQSRLQSDINAGYGLVAVAYEVAGGPHLVGHPSNSNVFHFIAIDGYLDYGATTHYADSFTDYGWSVPKYSTISSDTMVRIISGRPYYW